VVESGEQLTSCVPVFEAYELPNAIKLMNIGGIDIEQILKNILNTEGYQFSTASDMDNIRDIKEKLCEVRPTVKADKAEFTNQSKAYELPDGLGLVTLTGERQACTEVVFEPRDFDQSTNTPSIQTCCYESINVSDAEIRTDLLKNIYISGGNTLFKNFDSRLKAELDKLLLGVNELHINAPEERL